MKKKHNNSGRMTPERFRALSLENKCDTITFNGQFVVSRREGTCKIFLYVTEGIFVEVFFSTVHKKILVIDAFDPRISGDALNMYLQNITLPAGLLPERPPKKKRTYRKKGKPGDNQWKDLLSDN